MTKRQEFNLSESDRAELKTKMQEQLARVIVPAVYEMLEERFPGKEITYSYVLTSGEPHWLTFHIETGNKLRFRFPIDVSVSDRDLQVLAEKFS